MNHILKISIASISLIFYSLTLSGQQDKNWTLGPEFQLYPTGILPGVRIEKKLSSSSSAHLRMAFQLIDHRDLGKHNNETGSGYGFSLAYRKYFKSDFQELSLSARADLWRNTIDWSDNDPINSGITKITVLQPTMLLEYSFPNKNQISISPSLGFGYEWNIKTTGSPTGEGPILLIGISIGFQL